MLPIVIALSSAIVVYSVVLILFSNSPQEKVRERVRKLGDKTELENIHEEVLKEKKNERKAEKKSRLVSKRLEDNLAMSGLQVSAKEFILLWGGLTVIPALLGLLFELNTIAIIGIGVIGFAVPPILVNQAKTKRQLLFNKQLGEALTIMGNCMRSGYSFQQALSSIAKEMQPPISLEFGRVVREINYGASMEQALNNMVNRVNNKDLEILVSSVITSTQVGANLSEMLDTIAETVTDRIRLREEVRIASSQGRMSGIVIGLLPIAVILFLMITNPEYFTDFADTSTGKILLLISAVMEVSGFFVINKMVDIKY